MPPVPIADDAITCEVGLIECPAGQLEDWHALWAKLDSQGIALSERKVWDANGFRCAVVPAQPPPEFWQVIDPQIEYRDDDERLYREKLRAAQGKPPQQNLLLLHQVAIRPAQAYRVETTPVLGSLVWNITAPNVQAGNSMASAPARRSGQCQLAQCKMRISVFRRSGQVLVRLTPEIHYGETRPRFEGSLVSVRQQERITFHELAIEVPLQIGESAICSCNGSSDSGLGQLIFRSADGQLIRGLYVRVTGAKADDLFLPPD